MKKLKLILPLFFCFLFIFEANASYRETDFSPFPLSIKSETLLNGYWQSNDGYLEITEVEYYSINEHSWFIIYEVNPKDPLDKVVNGFIFFDDTDDSYKRVFWTDEGVVIKTFILYRLEERVEEPANQYCVHMNTYMLKMNEQMFVRTECDF